jgi:acyl dehydratase
LAIAQGRGVGYAGLMIEHPADIKDVEPGPVVELFLEDIEIGGVCVAGPIAVTADEIISFAERYDPLPMHVSDAGGEASVHESMIASGVLTMALKQRLIMSVQRNSAIIGAARLEHLDFVKPVRAGDDLTLRQECVGKRNSKSRSDRGLIVWEFELSNQAGEKVLTSRDIVMIRRRPA